MKKARHMGTEQFDIWKKMIKNQYLIYLPPVKDVPGTTGQKAPTIWWNANVLISVDLSLTLHALKILLIILLINFKQLEINHKIYFFSSVIYGKAWIWKTTKK